MIKVTLKRSPIGYEKSQRLTVRALGLGRIGSSAVHEETPQIQGMIRKIPHLLEVVKLDDPVEDKS